MGRGAVIAVSVWLAAIGGPVAAVRGQGNAPRPAPVVPILPMEPVLSLPPLPSFDQPPADPLATSTRTSLQPGTDRDPDPTAPATPTRPLPEVFPDGSGVVLPTGARQTIRFAPRYGKLNDYTVDKRPDGTQRLTYSGGLQVNVVTPSERPGQPAQEIEFAADNVVIWVRGLKGTADILGGGLEVDRTPKKDAPDADKQDAPKEKDERVTVELYLSGNVVIRTLGALTTAAFGPSQQILRAEEIYYDVDKNRAVALNADLETKFPTGPDSVHIRGREIHRLGRREWQAYDTSVFSSKQPADPALTVTSREATLVEQEAVRRNIFGRPYRDFRTGAEEVGEERILTGYQNRVRVLGVPLLFLPRYRTDLADPAGPLVSFLFRQGNVFGTQFYTTWDVYKLLAVRPPPDHQWRLSADYLSARGPALGTDYSYRNALLGPAYPNSGSFQAYVLHDKGEDLLGGFRGVEPDSSAKTDRWRGRVVWTHNQDLFEDGTTYARATARFAYLSDKNFFEQYYKQLFDSDPNQETFLRAYGAIGNISWSALGQANVNRPWVTETNWLPRADAALTGQTFWDDRIVYTGRATGGYAQFKPATQEPLSTLPSEPRAVDTGLFDTNHRVGLPLDAGPFRFEPYATGNATLYSKNLNGDSDARLYGGGGVRASIPFSRLYENITSDLFNVRGINHKITAGANFFSGYASSDRRNYPLLNRLNDDNLDLTYRTWRPWAPTYISGPGGVALQSSPLFDPQTLAVRKFVDNRPETLDTLSVFQFDLKQRWQTKRGLPGADHTVDWMSLDLSASVYPNPTRDNFGQVLGFLEYNYVWNVGDRTALSSSGWIDPNTNGPRYVNVGAWYNRPDGSNFYLGYRYTDPVNSRVLVASVGYQLSTKYSLSLTNAFDFGSNLAQSTQLTFNRTGTDVTTSFGFSFSALVPGNNVGFQFLIIPNAALATTGGARAIGPLALTGAR